jgi:predicted GNAT family N-acyltransferase
MGERAVNEQRVVPAPIGTPLWHAALSLRMDVFVVEQNVPIELERDDADDDARTRHLVIAAPDRATAAATVRWVIEPVGFAGIDPELGAPVHLQRLAVARTWRGQGLGAALVDAVEQEAAAIGALAVYLAAQREAVAFYDRLGYRAYGEPFPEAGIEHRHMVRVLDPGAARPHQVEPPPG